MDRDVALGRLTAAACRGDVSGELARVRRARVPGAAVDEALLQLHLFAGYPATINAFFARGGAAGAGGPSRADRRRGERICRRIYGAGYARMMRRMRELHPALPGWILADGYGRVMARPGLPLATRRRLAVAALAALGAWRQLVPYLRATPGAAAYLRRLAGAVPASRLRRALALARAG